MNPVIHFEIPYEDKTRVARFYEKAFGWQMRALGEEMDNYVLAATTATAAGGPETPGGIDGGFFPRRPDSPAQHPSVVIAVDSIRESMEKVRQAGGTVLGEQMDIHGVGTYVSFVDTEGNRVSMLQPIPRK